MGDDQKISLRESLRGFPVWQMFVVCLIRFSEPIAFTSMFPYVYFMIRDFGVVTDENNISAYTGYLSASFAFFQFLMCVQWSQISDRIGRKPVLLCGLLGTAISIVIFGFAPNFFVALFARSCMGALNGNIAVLRTVIGELATERRHQAVAFSTLPLLWNFGSVIGPLIGGSKYLTRPKKDVDVNISNIMNYNDFLNNYPYALSNIVVCLFLTFSLVMGFLFLEETNPRCKKRKDYGLEIGDWIRGKLGYHVPKRPWNRKCRSKPYVIDTLVSSSPAQPQETEPLIDEITESPLYQSTVNGMEDDIESLSSDAEDFPLPLAVDSISVQDNNCQEMATPTGNISRRSSLAFVRRFSSNPSVRPNISRTTTGSLSLITDDEIDMETSKSGFNRETFTNPVIMTSISNFLLSFQQLVFSEFLPVLLAGKFKKDELKFPITITGGFGYDSDSIGTLLSTTGFLGVLIITLLFPYMDRNYSTISGFRFSSSIFPFVYFFLPFIIFTLHDYNPRFPDWVSTVLIYLIAAISTLATATAFPQIVILIHRATLPQHRALVNGTTLSMNALARCIAPLTWGWLISFFDGLHLGGFSWWTLSLISIIALYQAFKMEEFDEDLKTQPQEQQEV